MAKTKMKIVKIKVMSPKEAAAKLEDITGQLDDIVYQLIEYECKDDTELERLEEVAFYDLLKAAIAVLHKVGSQLEEV